MILKFHYTFVFALKIKLITKPKKIAEESPAAAAFIPPVKAPSSPSLSTPSIAPFASVDPNPVIGIVIPALAKSLITSNTPIASNNAPINRKVTRIFADVIFVKLIKSCPSIHTSPPTKKTFK